ncbi:hypothetical protein ATE84_0743 [Aquimarina sp. MAR_2010_214]|uniref:DUF4177 domain-containing protein n=1 Tax=Aquimarina sp. MAR_2010_214 TaxID=1250026 RepID=UPI000CC1E05F|nr:DUF4177 domain-containing protein [Aquimarina sp. MAR_2010_214]PKV48735.1 hypothetical protein ATE84_0743 [Aquimarina sp. MAR_2010_214]
MGKQYKVIRISENWSTEKLRKKVENTMNEFSKQGWDVVDISFLANTNIAMITLSK